MAAPAEGVTFSSWARSPQPEWPYKLVEPDTAPKLTPTSVTARIAIVDALYAHAKPADDPRLPIPTPAKKKRPGGPSPRSRGAHRPATRARRVAANAAQASPPPPQALTLASASSSTAPRAATRATSSTSSRRPSSPGRRGPGAVGAEPRALGRPGAVRRMVRQALERLRKLRPAGLPMGSESKASATTGLVVGEAFQAGAPKPEAARLSAAFAPPSSPPRSAARARAASPAVAEDYCAPREAPAPAPEAAGRPHAWAKSCYVPMPTEYLHDCELGCGATYRLQKKAQHLGEECPKRLVLCKDCGERYVFENAKAHRDLECKSTASRWRNRATKSRLRAETRRITALLASQKRASNPAKAAAAAAAAAVVEEDDEAEAAAAAEATAGPPPRRRGAAPATAETAAAAATAAATAATAAETAATAAAAAATATARRETPATAAEQRSRPRRPRDGAADGDGGCRRGRRRRRTETPPFGGGDAGGARRSRRRGAAGPRPRREQLPARAAARGAAARAGDAARARARARGRRRAPPPATPPAHDAPRGARARPCDAAPRRRGRLGGRTDARRGPPAAGRWPPACGLRPAHLRRVAAQAHRSEVEALRKQLAAAESRAASAEASLASSTTQVKESALEIEDLRERNAALEEDVHRRLGHHDGRGTPAPTPAPSFLANDWWKQHFADGKIPSGTNLDAPAGYVAIEGAGPCMCRNPGWNLDSCGKLCCRGSPYTDPDPNGQYYIGKHKNGRICYKPEGAEYKDGDGGNSSGTASLAIIIPVVVAAVLLLAAVLFLVRKRVVAARQHRRESMPTVGDDKAEVEA
ncbi:hypothetical protein JL720_1566 [Aureococcus anophagefferens]|nr:hypothetical protein JL720_1566 [Aureococcus anophagefferens]